MATVRLTLALISSYTPSLLSFRGPLLRELARRGVKVWVLGPDYTLRVRAGVEALGALPVDYPLSRTGLSPLEDARSFLALVRFFRQERPRAVLTWQAKPNAYGIPAGVLAGVPFRAAVVEGLGYAFTPGEENFKKRLLREALSVLYRISFALAHKVFFLNPDDLEEFVARGLVRREKAVLLGGIGVPLEEWPPAPPHLYPPTFTLIARLLKEKGVREFAEAARRVKARHP
ncbi:MAG: glycosyltransferase, partial [Nitrososphaerota archaeon]